MSFTGLDKRGCHYAIPVQAKGGKDRVGAVQTAQDIRYCEQTFPGMRCRPVAAQFMNDGVIALFELSLKGDEIKIAEERHYKLVPACDLDKSAIVDYRT